MLKKEFGKCNLMQAERHITGHNETQVWEQVEKDLRKSPNLLQYRAVIEQQNRTLHLDIDIDPGGGLEGGFATTILSARFPNSSRFRFALHEKSFFDELGRFFGMQDVETGYQDFDEQIVVKTNDKARIRTILNDDLTRAVLQSLKDFTFEIVLPDKDSEEDEATLELIIEEGITDPVRLREIYRVYFGVLVLINPFSL